MSGLSRSETKAELWSQSVGDIPFKVDVYEEPSRGRTLYLRWRVDGNWRRRSLKRSLLRTASGRPDADSVAWAVRQADTQYQRLKSGRPDEEAMRLGPPLTIADGLVRVTDPQTGRYPADSAHRREVEAAVRFAARTWGSDRTWNSVRRADMRALWRARIAALRKDGQVGHRGAEITVARVLTVAAWLRQEELIDAGACTVARTWKQELRSDWRAVSGEQRDPQPKRPRHALEEMLRLLTEAWDVDPRFGLLLSLGAELRIGQVVRCRRSDLDLETKTLNVPSSGKKRGVLVKLTPGQLAAVARGLAGYLARCEADLADYPLFPQGQMPGGRKGDAVADPARHGDADPVDRGTLRDWFLETERRAEVTHVPRRGAYGIRRLAVDEYKKRGISREGLMAAGGWADSQVPDQIYADQEASYAADEAAVLRAKMRGEGS